LCLTVFVFAETFRSFFYWKHFGNWNISVICLTVVSKLAVAVFISLYFQTFWPKWLIFFGHFKNISVYDQKNRCLKKNSFEWTLTLEIGFIVSIRSVCSFTIWYTPVCEVHSYMLQSHNIACHAFSPRLQTTLSHSLNEKHYIWWILLQRASYSYSFKFSCNYRLSQNTYPLYTELIGLTRERLVALGLPSWTHLRTRYWGVFTLQGLRDLLRGFGLWQGWANRGPRAKWGSPQRFQWPAEAFGKSSNLKVPPTSHSKY